MNSLRWWITSVAQKNSYICKTYHQICYLNTGLELSKDHTGPGPLLLIAADRAVREALELNLPTFHLGGNEAIDGNRPPTIGFAKDWINVAARRLFFIFRETYRIFQSCRNLPRAELPISPVTILASYLTPEVANKGSLFHEAYFGDLAANLSDAVGDGSLATMPMIMRDVPFQPAIRGLRNSKLPVIVPHQYLRITDVVSAALATCFRPPRPPSWPALSEMDIGPLLEDALTSDWMSNRAADALLMSTLVRRWGTVGLAIDQIILVYENQPWERAVCWQVKRTFPEARLVGYQHARVPRLMLNFYMAPGGEPEAPQPDWVVTVGQHSAKILSEDGHDPSRVRVGGALQMQDLLELGADTSVRPSSETGSTVLFATSNGMEEAVELVEMAVNLVESEEGVNQGIKVVLKCHPLLPFFQINSIVGVQLPNHVEQSEQPVTDLIRNSSIMVYSGSTVCIQALVLGVPMIHLRPSFDFDLDPLETTPNARLEASSLEEMREQVSWLLENRDSYIAQHRDEWSALAKEMYGPVTKETVNAFLP